MSNPLENRSAEPFWPLSSWPANLFGLQAPVDQRHYLEFGIALMVFKYIAEAAAIFALTGQAYTPIDFVNPLVSSRERFTAAAPIWLGMSWVLWTLPFLWIAVSMSIRRASRAGISPWFGLLVLVPIVNLLTMIVMAFLPDAKPTSEAERLDEAAVREAYRSPPADTETPRISSARRPRGATSGVMAAIIGMACGAGYLVFIMIFSIYLFESYGAALFFGTPIVTGAFAAYSLNTPVSRGFAITLGHSVLTLSIACIAFLAFGLEGMICIIMAIPIMLPLGMLGALVGYMIATSARRPNRNEFRGLLGTLVILPMFSAAESQLQSPPEFEVLSAVEIAASPEVVWENVVEFAEIEEPPEWYFQMGFAAPLRAHIEGSGVGATRYCEFTTGAFVEPITVWNRPARLAFDVTEQPEPMFELTPYGHLHPPHLTRSFRSERGEFRVVPISDGLVRLEGRTWYRLEIYPVAYWSVWTDAIVHRIHERVLRQIKRSAEREV